MAIGFVILDLFKLKHRAAIGTGRRGTRRPLQWTRARLSTAVARPAWNQDSRAFPAISTLAVSSSRITRAVARQLH
jgi:hypothetical protein